MNSTATLMLNCNQFALVARELLGKRPLDRILLATRIASATVEAFEQHRTARDQVT